MERKTLNVRTPKPFRRNGGVNLKHKCPRCHKNMKKEGKGFDSCFKCPNCGYAKEWRFCRAAK